jgi:hypothetical protein
MATFTTTAAALQFMLPAGKYLRASTETMCRAYQVPRYFVLWPRRCGTTAFA